MWGVQADPERDPTGEEFHSILFMTKICWMNLTQKYSENKKHRPKYLEVTLYHIKGKFQKRLMSWIEVLSKLNFKESLISFLIAAWQIGDKMHYLNGKLLHANKNDTFYKFILENGSVCSNQVSNCKLHLRRHDFSFGLCYLIMQCHNTESKYQFPYNSL